MRFPVQRRGWGWGGKVGMKKKGCEVQGVLCCWQPRAISGQPTETGTLCLQCHLQLKQTGVMQEALEQTHRCSSKWRQGKRHRAGESGEIMGEAWAAKGRKVHT